MAAWTGRHLLNPPAEKFPSPQSAHLFLTCGLPANLEVFSSLDISSIPQIITEIEFTGCDRGK